MSSSDDRAERETLLERVRARATTRPRRARRSRRRRRRRAD